MLASLFDYLVSRLRKNHLARLLFTGQTISGASNSYGISGVDMLSREYVDTYGRKVLAMLADPNDLPGASKTTFTYSPLSELLTVTDPLGAVTTYDLAGRVKTENHPDRGLTTTYDKASNVIAINTPATQSFGGSITMSYSYNRLVKKYMPNSSGTDLYDVDYIYGSYNDGRNGAGRIISITQGGGFKSDSYRYDELGQRVEEDITVDVPMYGYRDFNTKKYFDSFGRILQAVYPDGDQVDYDYNSLGELNTIKSKVAGVTQDIVSAISYNGYGQISQLTYGNGTTTSYSYATGNTNKATTLMGSTVNAKEQGASAFTPVLSRTYTYNKQGMVAQMNRSVAGSLLSQVGNASFTDAYTYDRFGRLGAHAQSKGGTSIYSLDMQYNQAGGITFKTSNGSGFMNASALNYDLLYSYSGNYGHQLERIDDPVNASTTYFTYNTSGSITQIDDPTQAISQNFFWNQQQQLTGVNNQQGAHHYIYDHSGERIMKSSLINSTVYLNDQVIDDVSNLEPYTVYVNPYYVVTGLMGGDRVSKHYYMNQQRVATDITINYDPNGTGGGEQEQSLAKDAAAAAPELSPALANFNEVLVGLDQKPLDTASLKLPTIASYYPEAAKTPATSSSAEGTPSAPRILFWYHPDYLGNVDLITERDGYTHEFFMYNPWGEEMHQWNANTYAFTSPYRFNAKELDPETGLAYYGARYYQNKIGVWLSVDPKAADAPGWSPYSMGFDNPIIFVDPDGQYPIYIITRSYAPFKTFGPENQWYGDDRGHTLDMGASYRSMVSIMHDTELLTTTATGGHSRSHTVDGSKDAESRTLVENNRPKGKYIDVHSAGRNEAQFGSFDIDQYTKLTADIEGDVKKDHILNIIGTISGDNFPNQESMIRDIQGNTVWLGNFKTSGDREWGPVWNLMGSDEGDVQININVRIKVNADGVFQGVMQGDKMISIADWNKQIESNGN